jgi:putative hemolysin
MLTDTATPIRRCITALLAVGALLALAGCGGDDGSSTPGGDEAATTFCTDKGGTPETRQPYWGTNLDQSSWVQLAGSIDLCRFEADDESRIYIDAASLAAEQPSLAAAAYLAKLPIPDTSGGANPAAADCTTTVGGTSTWGSGVNGGGWVNLDDPTFTVLDLCVFPDGSAIDEWGIAYYSGGVVRGADLAPMFRFDASNAAGIFGAPPTTAG